MEVFVNMIVDHPVVDKINLSKIQDLITEEDLPSLFETFKKLAVTLVIREPNDYEFDAFDEEGVMYLVIPLLYEQVLKGTEEEVTQLCLQLFNYWKDKLPLGGAES